MDQDKKPKLTPSLEILETAIKVWWKNLAKIIGVYLWGLLFALIPVAIILALVGLRVWLAPQSLPTAINVIATLILIVSFLVALYFSIRAYMGIFLLVKKNYEGNELAIFKETKNLFWPYFGLTILTTIFILLWTLLLIIPGIIYSILYSFAVYAFFFEGKRGLAAIRRSKELAANYWWAIFGRFLVLGLALAIFMIIISLPLSFATQDSGFAIFWNGVTQVINVLVGPIALLFSYQIYQDLVKIKK